MRRVLLLTLAGALLVAGCGDNAPPADDTASLAPTPEATLEPVPEITPEPEAEASVCREPSGTEKGSLRFEVRAHDRELKDTPWALVRRRGVNYMAAEIDALGPRLVVLVSFPQHGKYLAGMRAVNGTARTFTDLPGADGGMPSAGERALDCVG